MAYRMSLAALSRLPVSVTVVRPLRISQTQSIYKPLTRDVQSSRFLAISICLSARNKQQRFGYTSQCPINRRITDLKRPGLESRGRPARGVCTQRDMGQQADMTEAGMKELWKRTDCVCFDVDSTVCTDEAIDELATFLNVGDEVAHLTNDAMIGSMTYNESLRKRLDIISPTRQQITDFIQHHPPSLTPGIKELTAGLKKKGVPVYLITGGFQSIVESVAKLLDIPKENIFANKIKFFYNGDYAGFDETCPTCESGGKPRVMTLLKERHGYKCVIHIGDGVTDMEACPPAEGFIGFGGNQVREKVKTGSAWFVTDFQELISELS